MNSVVLVWVLILSTGSNAGVQELGPYHDRESCEAVRRVATQVAPYVGKTECIQVRKVAL